MARLLVHVEGQTEEDFVNEILAPYLYTKGYVSVSARLIGNARLRDNRGGIRSYHTVREDILKHLRYDKSALATLMVDLYGLPAEGLKAWPGRSAANNLPFEQKAAAVEDAILNDINQSLGINPTQSRFIPYIMMYEFEGLLFSDCDRFAEGIGQDHLTQEFQAIRDSFNSPEEINDSPLTAPSKRIENLFPIYQKPLYGALAVINIGLDAIRSECPHFNNWLQQLEEWPSHMR